MYQFITTAGKIGSSNEHHAMPLNLPLEVLAKLNPTKVNTLNLSKTYVSLDIFKVELKHSNKLKSKSIHYSLTTRTKVSTEFELTELPDKAI